VAHTKSRIEDVALQHGLKGPRDAPWRHLSVLCCRQAPAYAPALLRLCSTLELKASGSLEGITAILGCPVCLPALEGPQAPNLQELPAQQRKAFCLSLWLAVDWLREAVNSFSADTQGCANTIGLSQYFSTPLLLFDGMHVPNSRTCTAFKLAQIEW
jgi:hypothetical protein